MRGSLRGAWLATLTGFVFLVPMYGIASAGTNNQGFPCPVGYNGSTGTTEPPPPSECVEDPVPPDDPPPTIDAIPTSGGSSSVGSSSKGKTTPVLVKIKKVRGISKKYDEFKNWITGYAGYILLKSNTKLYNDKGKLISRSSFVSDLKKTEMITCKVDVLSQSKWKKIKDQPTPTFDGKRCSLG